MKGKNNRMVKGQYGYIDRQRKKVIIWTIFLFAVALGLFGMGIWSTGTKKNLLTIVAILGCLPACKSAVQVIMLLKAKGCSKELKDRVSTYGTDFTELYDLFFTSYEKNYQVSHMVIKGSVVLGCTEDAKCDTSACEKHLDGLLKRGGCKGVAVKIYEDVQKYCEGLENLKKQEVEMADEEKLEDIVMNLMSVSL